MDLKTVFEPGMPIVLKARREDAEAEFETTVVEIVGECLLCDPIMHEGKAVNFKAPGLKTEISVFDKNAAKMYCWRDLDIKLGYYKKKTLCQLVYVTGEPVVINRRACYRQYVGVSGKVTYFRKPMDVIIRDVCNNGVGIVSHEKGEFETGKTITVNFSDEDGKYKFELKCQVMRERQMDNGNYEYGCQVINPPHSLSMYVAHKQLEERKRVLGHV